MLIKYLSLMGDDIGRKDFLDVYTLSWRWHCYCGPRFWDHLCIPSWNLKIRYISSTKNMETVSSLEFKLLIDFYKHRVELLFMNISLNMPDQLQTKVGFMVLFWWYRCYCVVHKDRINILNQWNGLYPEPYYHYNWLMSKAKSFGWFRWWDLRSLS